MREIYRYINKDGKYCEYRFLDGFCEGFFVDGKEDSNSEKYVGKKKTEKFIKNIEMCGDA